DPLPPGLVLLGQPVLERLLRAAVEHRQQPGGAGAVADRREVDGDRDVLVTLPRVPPGMLVDPDHAVAVQAGRVGDQQAPALRPGPRRWPCSTTRRALRRRGPWTGAGPRCRPGPSAARRGRSWPVARPRRWCPDATRARTRCTGSGAR